MEENRNLLEIIPIKDYRQEMHAIEFPRAKKVTIDKNKGSFQY